MMDIMFGFKDYGLLGLILGGLFGTIFVSDKFNRKERKNISVAHSSERDKWLEQSNKHNEELIEVIKDNNKVTTELKIVLEGVKGTIKSCQYRG